MCSHQKGQFNSKIQGKWDITLFAPPRKDSGNHLGHSTTMKYFTKNLLFSFSLSKHFFSKSPSVMPSSPQTPIYKALGYQRLGLRENLITLSSFLSNFLHVHNLKFTFKNKKNKTKQKNTEQGLWKDLAERQGPWRNNGRPHKKSYQV